MPGTPEVPKPTQPEIQEVNRDAEFIVDETLKNAGVQVVQKNFTPIVKDDHGTPLTQTPPTRVIEVTPPASQEELKSWSKGSVDSTKTWLGKFWSRIIDKAKLLGWRILGRGNTNAT